MPQNAFLSVAAARGTGQVPLALLAARSGQAMPVGGGSGAAAGAGPHATGSAGAAANMAHTQPFLNELLKLNAASSNGANAHAMGDGALNALGTGMLLPTPMPGMMPTPTPMPMPAKPVPTPMPMRHDGMGAMPMPRGIIGVDSGAARPGGAGASSSPAGLATGLHQIWVAGGGVPPNFAAAVAAGLNGLANLVSMANFASPGLGGAPGAGLPGALPGLGPAGGLDPHLLAYLAALASLGGFPPSPAPAPANTFNGMPGMAPMGPGASSADMSLASALLGANRAAALSSVFPYARPDGFNPAMLAPGSAAASRSAPLGHEIVAPDGRRLMQCVECKRTYQTREGLRLHVRNVHVGDKQHRCGDCSRAFARAGDLQLHVIRMHCAASERPFPCTFDECAKRFACKSELVRHERTHGTKGRVASDSDNEHDAEGKPDKVGGEDEVSTASGKRARSSVNADDASGASREAHSSHAEEGKGEEGSADAVAVANCASATGAP